MGDPLLPGLLVSIPTLPINPRTAASFVLASFVVQIYDWLLTSAVEVDRIWLMEWNAFTLLWFLVRYIPVAGRVLAVVGSFKLSWSPQVRVEGAPALYSGLMPYRRAHYIAEWMNDATTNSATRRCARFSRTPPIFFGLSLLLTHFALLLRAHALWDRRIAVSALPFMLWLAEVGMNLIPIVRPSSVAKPIPGVPGCAVSPGPSETRLLSITIAFGVAFDLATSVLVIARCMSYWRHSVRGPLLSMLLVHSAGYFILVLVLGAVNLIFVLGAVNNITIKIFWLMLASTIPSITVNRMLLSLRAFSTPPMSTVSSRAQPDAELRSIKLTRAFGLNTVMNSFEGQQPAAASALPVDEEPIELQGATSS